MFVIGILRKNLMVSVASVPVEGRMSPSHEHQTRRTVEYEARTLLQNLGYQVARVGGRDGAVPGLYHLIAWERMRGTLFIRIGSPRMGKSMIRSEILLLSTNLQTVWYPGEVQFWIGEGYYWKRYRILPGGAILLPEVRA